MGLNMKEQIKKIIDNSYIGHTLDSESAAKEIAELFEDYKTTLKREIRELLNEQIDESHKIIDGYSFNDHSINWNMGNANGIQAAVLKIKEKL